MWNNWGSMNNFARHYSSCPGKIVANTTFLKLELVQPILYNLFSILRFSSHRLAHCAYLCDVLCHKGRTLSCSCLHCAHCTDLWPLCLLLQITSEVHLFSHTKGKKHQQAVRDSSSIQGRELSDEEVVRITNTLLGTNIPLLCQRLVPCCRLCFVNRQSETAVVLLT